jgi:hypothetical protein
MEMERMMQEKTEETYQLKEYAKLVDMGYLTYKLSTYGDGDFRKASFRICVPRDTETFAKRLQEIHEEIAKGEYVQYQWDYGIVPEDERVFKYDKTHDGNESYYSSSSSSSSEEEVEEEEEETPSKKMKLEDDN